MKARVESIDGALLEEVKDKLSNIRLERIF
jgi:hypothetical protein